MTAPAATPERVFRGLVGPGGVAGAGVSGKSWNLVIRCIAWQPGVSESPGAALPPPVTAWVRCLLPMSKEESAGWFKRVAPYDVVDLAYAEGSPESGTITHARIVQTDVEDAALNALARELQKPLTIQPPDFGPLVYDRRFDCYEGHTAWGGREVELSLETGASDPRSPAVLATLEHARALLADQQGWAKRINDFAVARLLPLKNDTWPDEDDAGEVAPALDAEAFLARMELTSIRLTPGGDFTFWHDDGELFYGHAIQISGTLADGPTDADIPG